MSQEGEVSKEREDIPPVLPVSSATSTSSSPPSGGATGGPTVVTTVGEPGATLTQKLDTWQAANIPEEKTYFSSDVSGISLYLFLVHCNNGYDAGTRYGDKV